MLRTCLAVILVATIIAVNECPCGYGGPCLRPRENGGRIRYKALCAVSVCSDISGGFYRNCTHIKNHCTSSPCQRGNCTPTFGGYFCECPPDYHGKSCEILSPDLSRTNVTNQVYVYYQVQPHSDGTNLFYVVHDTGDQQRILREAKIQLRPVMIFDNQYFHPSQGSGFLKMDVKRICQSDLLLNPDLNDRRVCEYLPEGDVWTFRFDSTLYGKNSVQAVYPVERFYGPIGRASEVKYEVVAFFEDGKRELLFSNNYTIFTYYAPRNPHFCDMEMSFRGCSLDVKSPLKTSRGVSITIKAIHSVNDLQCHGVLEIKNEWYLQKNILAAGYTDPEQQDDVPKFLESNIRSHYLRLKPRALRPGLHMVLYAVTLRGTPPHYGRSNEFKMYSHCYIETLGVPPNLVIEGGENRTMSCLQVLYLNVISLDDNYQIDEFEFTVSCNNASDPECSPQTVEGNSYKKMVTPCNSTYHFQFDVKCKYTDIACVDHLRSTVEFATVQTSVALQCLFNCYAINVKSRMLMAATTSPYQENPVNWTILVAENPIGITYADPEAFDGVSRILRIEGNAFRRFVVKRTDIRVTVRKGMFSKVTSLDLAFNMEFWIEQFRLLRKRYFSYAYEALSGDIFASESEISPVEYWVFTINKVIRESLVEVVTTHYDKIRFNPHYELAVLCVRASLRSKFAEHCTRPVEVEPDQTVELNDLDEEFLSGDTERFLRDAHFYLVDNVVSAVGSLRWEIALSDRKEIATWMSKIKLDENVDVFSALSTLSVLFYTADGCKDQDLPTFIEDPRLMVDYTLAVQWLQTNHLAIISLYRAVRKYGDVIAGSYHTFRKYPSGYSSLQDVPALLMRCWALAYFQDGFLREHIEQQTIEEEYLFAETSYWIRKNAEFLNSSLILLSERIATITPLLYGLRRRGAGSVKSWFARSSYKGLQAYMNRSNPQSARDESDDFADFYFGPKDADWINKLELHLFDPILEWRFKEFSLVVVVVKPRKRDMLAGVKMLVDLRQKDGLPISKLPDGENYYVALPEMLQGKLAPRGFRVKPAFEVDFTSTPGLPAYKYVTTYKLVVPASVQTTPVWTLYLYSNESFQLRAKAFFRRAPEAEEVEEAPLISSYYASNVGRYAVEVVAVAEEGDIIPDVFYLGFRAESIFKGADLEREREHNVVPCNCSHFGIVSLVDYWCNFAKILLEPIQFVYPTVINVGGILSCLVLLITGVVLLVFAIRNEKNRDLKKTLIFASDSLPNDANYIIVGVYTGSSPLAGTSSSVAIKISGSESSSKVHLLKSVIKTTLRPHIDDWFIIPTSHHLGKVLSVTLWSNYHRLSDWYCSKIMIHDLATQTWYKAAVEQWLRIGPSNDDSRMLTVDAYLVQDMELEAYEDDSFSYYYGTELCNTHIPLSLFYLNTRSMASLEMRAITFITKFYAFFILTWAVQQHVGKYILDPGKQLAALGTCTLHASLLSSSLSNNSMGYIEPAGIHWFARGDLYPSRLIVFDGGKFWVIFLVAMATRLITWPMRIWFRSGVVSRRVQRKTTSPNMFFLHDTSPQLDSARPSSVSRSSYTKSLVPGISAKRQTSDPLKKSQRDSRGGRTSRFHSTAVSLKRQASYGSHSVIVLWRKTPYFQMNGPHLIAVLVMGPSQFRCVNVTKQVFAYRTKKSRALFRIVIGTFLVGMLAFIFIIELLTDYWLKTRAAAFLVAVTVLFDSVVIEPSLIFLRCFLGYCFIKMRNAETALWNYSHDKSTWFRPVPLGYKEYVEKVTSKEYKPLISPEIEEKRRCTQLLYSYCQGCLALLAIGVSCCAYFSISGTEKLSIFMAVRTNEFGFSGPIHSLVDKPRITVDKVVDPNSAFDYVTSVMAESDTTWTNGRYITPHRRRLGKDHSSYPLGSIHVFVVIMEHDTGHMTIPLQFIEYFHEGKIWGDLYKGRQETKPVFIYDTLVMYDVAKGDYILGKSLEAYPMAGHVVHVQAHPWPTYYSGIRELMLAIYQNDGAFIPRAIIYTANYINPNTPTIVTVDVVVELHTSGVGSAKLKVRGMIISTSNLSLILWIIISVVTVLLLFVTAVLISRRGFKACFSSPHGRIPAELFIACFIKSLSAAFFQAENVKIMREIEENPVEVYTDFHDEYVYNLYDDASEAAIIFFSLSYLLMLLREQLKKYCPLYSHDLPMLVFLPAFFLAFITAFVFTEYEMLHNHVRTISLFNIFALKELFRTDCCEPQYRGVIWPCWFLAVMVKSFAGYFAFQYRWFSESLNEPLIDQLRRNRQASSAFAFNPRASIKPKRSGPTPSPEPSQSSSPAAGLSKKIAKKFFF